MSYESVKLALTPSLWYRNDEESGTTMFDSSGNDEHQTYNFDPVDPILLGQLSGVETVPESRSIFGTDRIAQWVVTPVFDERLTFTWEALVRQTIDHTQNRTIIHRDTTGGGNSLFFSGSSGGMNCLFALRVGGVTFSVTGNINVLMNSWYHVIGVRNDTVMFLMLNGVVVASRSDLPAGVPIDVAGTDRIALASTALNNTLQWLGNSEEYTFYDYALTATQGLEVYESMINSLFLVGRADANPTGILRSDFEPDPVEFPWRHNWVEPLVERISFRSAVSSSVDGNEEGVSQRISPRRELEFNQLIRGNVERRKLRAQLWANQHAKWFVPVRQYAEQLLEPVSASATTTPISTVLKDYEAGGWIGLRQYDASGNVEHSEVRLISSLSPLVHEALENSYVAYRSIVYPVRRALIPSAISLRGHTDAVEEVTLTFRLLPEDEALIPNRMTTFTPTLKYRDVEVFDGQLWQSNDWSEERDYEVERTGSDIDFEDGLLGFESDTIGASETFSYRMTLSGHTNIAAFLGWFYERRGALAYLWVPTIQSDFEILGVNAPNMQITVRDTNYSDSYALAEPRRDLAFMYFDGSVELRRVVAFEGTTNETLTLDAAVPSMTNLRLVSLLKYCRLDADQLELAWHTDQVVQVAWRFREALHTPEGVGLSSLSPSASLSGSLSPSASASPSASVSPSLSPSLSPSPSASISPSASLSPSFSPSPSGSISATDSPSPSPSSSESPSPSLSVSPSSSQSLSPSPSASASASISPSASLSPSSSASPSV